MKIQPICLVGMLLILCPVSLLAQNHTKRGAVLGGLAGALAGAGIGEHNGEAGAGALIGGAVGLVTGAAIGDSMDQQEDRDRAAFQHQLAAQRSRATSISDVVTMTQGGVSDEVIINQINKYGVTRRVEVSDVIALHQQGVSERVISAMQRARVGGTPTTTTTLPPPPRYQAPVVVQEHHYVAPAPVYHWHGSPVRHRHYYHHPQRSRVRWSIGVVH